MSSVYFIRDEATGLIKIGRATDPWVRLSHIQCHCPGQLTMLALEDGAADREAELHAQFRSDRQRGEWFRAGPELTAYIASLGPLPKRKKMTKSTAFWGITDEQLAERVTVHRATITRIRQGKWAPNPLTAIEIQRATGMSAIKLVFGDLAEEAA